MLSVPRPDDELVAGWRASLNLQVAAGDLPRTTKRTLEWGFAQFLDWLDHQHKSEVSGSIIRRWVESLQAQGYNSFSVGFWLECVKNFFAWAVENEFFAFDPTLDVQSEVGDLDIDLKKYAKPGSRDPLVLGEFVRKARSPQARTRPPFSL